MFIPHNSYFYLTSFNFIIARQHAIQAEHDTVTANRPSVHPSVYSTKWVDILSHFLTVWLGHGIILASEPYCCYKIPREPPLWGGIKYTGWENVCNYRFLSWKWYETGPWFLRITNSKSHIADRYVSSNDLEWPWKSGHKGLKFSGRSP